MTASSDGDFHYAWLIALREIARLKQENRHLRSLVIRHQELTEEFLFSQKEVSRDDVGADRLDHFVGLKKPDES